MGLAKRVDIDVFYIIPERVRDETWARFQILCGDLICCTEDAVRGSLFEEF